MKRRRILAAAIPLDLLISEVLVHLPAKSIARCRCVCSSWRAGIAAAAFVRRHRDLSRARPPPSCMLPIPHEINATTTAISFSRLPLPSPGHTVSEVDPDLAFDTAVSPEPDGDVMRVVYLAHCDGLVAITTATGRVFVSNPATQEFVALPRGAYNAELECRKPRRLPVAPIGFDRWRNSYVVARYFYLTYVERLLVDEATGEWSSYDYADNIGHEVFTLGGGSWELTDDPPHAIGGVHQPVCTRRGFYYWQSDDVRGCVSRPTTTAGSNHLDGMAFLDGKLCYVHVAAKELASLHIWMANDDDEGLELEWSLLCRVDIPDPVYNLMFSDMVYRCWLYGGRIDGMAVDMQPDGSSHNTGFGPVQAQHGTEALGPGRHGPVLAQHDTKLAGPTWPDKIASSSSQISSLFSSKMQISPLISLATLARWPKWPGTMGRRALSGWATSGRDKSGYNTQPAKRIFSDRHDGVLCRCVCRSWRAGIAAAAFVRRHRDLSRARPPSSVLAIPRECDPDDRHATSTDITFHRLVLPPPGQMATEADVILHKTWHEGITRAIYPTHCDGLVAIATATDKVFVSNPATGEFAALPLCTHNAELDHGVAKAVPVALGFDKWRNSYVVARYFYRTYGETTFDEATDEWVQDGDYDIGHEVFTLGGGGGGGGPSWELTDDPPHAIEFQSPICTWRGFYWYSDMPKLRLMRFGGLRDRKFEVVPRPPTPGWSHLDSMATMDGKLCYVHAAADASFFQLWIADDGQDLQWSLRCRIVHAPGFRYFKPIIADGDMLVVAVGETVNRYNVQNGSMEEVVDKQLRLQYKRLEGSDSSDDDKMRRGILVADDIPADLVISEVLVRLPIKSIVCCHCVCRSWCAAISGDAFAAASSSMLSILFELNGDGYTTNHMSFYRLPLLAPPGPTTTVVESDLLFDMAWTKGTRHVHLSHCDGLVTIMTSRNAGSLAKAGGLQWVILRHLQSLRTPTPLSTATETVRPTVSSLAPLPPPPSSLPPRCSMILFAPPLWRTPSPPASWLPFAQTCVAVVRAAAVANGLSTCVAMKHGLDGPEVPCRRRPPHGVRRREEVLALLLARPAHCVVVGGVLQAAVVMRTPLPLLRIHMLLMPDCVITRQIGEGLARQAPADSCLPASLFLHCPAGGSGKESMHAHLHSLHRPCARVQPNPATQELPQRRGRLLRPPPADYTADGFDRWRNSYIVARYFYRRYGKTTTFDDEATGEPLSWWDYDIGHEVFTLGSEDGSWEVTDDPPGAIGVQAPICTRRGFYWHSGMPKPRLLRFGLKDRAFEVVAPRSTAWPSWMMGSAHCHGGIATATTVVI
ncbi:hypothetical protein HU200_010637 [Digitaria exilis]|uniref:F-box domain-containing protein n=1 Tax=Digitaria exilis TaxID=1010633 RepID=A0A835KNC2_9POAL|nr:hypothetical protein HU200_010637 [Digitaria exilis]